MVADRDLAAAEETARAIRDEGHQADAVACDLLLADQCRAAVDAAVARFGGLHLLVNNAGLSNMGDVIATAEADFALIMDVNVKGYFLSMKYAIPAIEQSGGGAVLNISSMAALRGGLGTGVAYDTSKAALSGMMRNTAVAAARRKVRVNNLLPGFINSPMVRKANGGTCYDFSAKVPLGRMGVPWDVAKAAIFLLSDDADYITGIELSVDGGTAAALL